jgi:hypothetical protein
MVGSNLQAKVIAKDFLKQSNGRAVFYSPGIIPERRKIFRNEVYLGG